MSSGSRVEPAQSAQESQTGQVPGEKYVCRKEQKATEESEEQGSDPTVQGREVMQQPVGKDKQHKRKEVEKSLRRSRDAQGMNGVQTVNSRAKLKQRGVVQLQCLHRDRNKDPKEPKGAGPFFFFGGENGASIVVMYCESKGWQRIYNKNREDYKLKWSEIKSRRTYNNFRAGEQLVFQIPNNKVLTTKIGLLNSLREYDRVSDKVNCGQGLRRMKMDEFFPETFRMDLRNEREAFFAQPEELCGNKGNMWICKPTGLNQGRGIFLLQSPEDIRAFKARIQNAAESLINGKTPFRMPQARIVQRYIQNPLLLNGRKFDVRSYFLIASTSPYMVFFRHGYVRLTCDLYDPASSNLTAHLTNQYMQKKNPLYSVVKEDTVWSMEQLNLYINERFTALKSLPTDWAFGAFAKQMQQIMIQCFLAVKAKLECKLGYFDLIGCDFMIDDNFKVWLLEMNCNPALHTNCEVLKKVVPRTVTETLDLTLEIFSKCHSRVKLLPLSSQRDFVLLYCGESMTQTFTKQRSTTAGPHTKSCPKSCSNAKKAAIVALQTEDSANRSSKQSVSPPTSKPPVRYPAPSPLTSSKSLVHTSQVKGSKTQGTEESRPT